MRIRRAKWLIAALLVSAACIASPGARGADPDGSETTAEVAEKKGPNLTEIRSRAQSMPIDRRIDIDKRVAASVERVNKQAEGKGQSVMAARLASELGMSAEALLDEKGKLGFNWGEMVIAQTLLANSAEAVTLSDLATLRSAGLSWAAIAFGLGFHLEDFEDAVKAQGKVAMGLARPAGKAPPTEK